MTAHLCDVVTSFTADAPVGGFFFYVFCQLLPVFSLLCAIRFGGGCFIDSLQH